MKKMLLSIKPNVYEKIKSGVKVFEHRRNFPDEPIMAYLYLSSPVKAVKGIIITGKRHVLADWKNEYSYDVKAVERIAEYEKNYRYAMEIVSFQDTTSIPLSDLRKNISGFVAPQMYIYLDNTILLEYIENNIEKTDVKIIHEYSNINSDMICVH